MEIMCVFGAPSREMRPGKGKKEEMRWKFGGPLMVFRDPEWTHHEPFVTVHALTPHDTPWPL